VQQIKEQFSFRTTTQQEKSSREKLFPEYSNLTVTDLRSSA